MTKDPRTCKHGNLWERDGYTKCNLTGKMIRASGTECEQCPKFKNRLMKDKTNGKPIR